eukprot:TRINITY_DN89206_c0_g1_i1.p1 TRINITY_DN89206_c0_g1~~TRINITY_DN89206_c0_g1_i1.p1  ORF type:complete len:846 (+),score=99.58 TRINITY_DN89206_c0_g1_i1:337-2538(+)
MASLLSLIAATEFADTADHVLPLQLTCAVLNASNFLVTGIATYWKWETKAEKNWYAANEYDALLSRLDMLKNSVEILGTNFWTAFEEMEAKIGEVKQVCGPPDIWVEKRFKRDKLLKDLSPLYQLQMERQRVMWGCLGQHCPSIVIACLPSFCIGLTRNRSCQKLGRPTNGELHGHASKSCRELDVIDQKLDTMVRNVKANFFEPPTSMGILWQQIRLLFEETISSLDLPSSLSLMPLILPHLSEFRKFSPNADTPLHIAAKSGFQPFFEHVIMKRREFQPGTQLILADVDECLPLDYFVLPDGQTMGEFAERDRVLIVRLFLTTLAEAALESIYTWRDLSKEARESEKRQHMRRICLDRGLLSFALKNQIVAPKWGNPEIMKLPVQRDAPEHISGLSCDGVYRHGWSTEPSLMHLVAFYGDRRILEEALTLISKAPKTTTSNDLWSNFNFTEHTDNENHNVLVYACQAVIAVGELEPARMLMIHVIEQHGTLRASEWLHEARESDPKCHKHWWWPYDELRNEFFLDEDECWQLWNWAYTSHGNGSADSAKQGEPVGSDTQETQTTTGSVITMVSSEKKPSTVAVEVQEEVDPDCALLAVARPQHRALASRKRVSGSSSVSCRRNLSSNGDPGRPEHPVAIPVNRLRMAVSQGSSARWDRLPASRPDGTAEMPTCRGCERSMFWNDCHEDAWHCENFAHCRNGEKNMGQGRWYCKSCRRDVCKACQPHHADDQ